MKRALIIGSAGTIGNALSELLQHDYQLRTISRPNFDLTAGQSFHQTSHQTLESNSNFTTDYSDQSLAKLAQRVKEEGALDLIICCIGVLHNELLAPEKRLSQVNSEKLAEYFRINTILPTLCLKEFAPLLNKQSRSRFVLLSAMVGSITDNALGGWYGYRSSKAALNMMVKTASIELARTHKTSSLAVIHPGTTRGPLSKPFASNVSSDKYYTPKQSAERILSVVESLTPERSGSFLNWDGSDIPW